MQRSQIMKQDADGLIHFLSTFIFLKTNKKNNRLNKIYSRHMQSLCTLLLLIRSAQLSTKKRKHNGGGGVKVERGGCGAVVGEERTQEVR